MNMPKEFYIAERSSINNAEFCGIYKGDFEAFHSLADIAKRIESDRRFNLQCQKAAKNNEIFRKSKQKEMN